MPLTGGLPRQGLRAGGLSRRTTATNADAATATNADATTTNADATATADATAGADSDAAANRRCNAPGHAPGHADSEPHADTCRRRSNCDSDAHTDP